MGERKVPPQKADAARAVVRPGGRRSSEARAPLGGRPHAPSGWVAAFAIPTLAAIAACDPTVSVNASIGSPCSVQADCPNGQVCAPTSQDGAAGETCQSTCTGDPDCRSDLVCTPVGDSGQAACTPPVQDGSVEANTDAGTAVDTHEPEGDATLDGPPSSDGGADVQDEGVEQEGGPGSDGEPSIGCDGGSPPTTLVLFGGQSASAVLGDTWVWDGQSWSNPDAGPTGSPPARQQAAMSTACGYAVVAGGTDSSGKWLSDAWLWNGAAWRQAPSAPPRSPGPSAGPPARTSATMTAY